jgi:hypothetical protein
MAGPRFFEDSPLPTNEWLGCIMHGTIVISFHREGWSSLWARK